MINRARIDKHPYAKLIPMSNDDGREHHGEVILDDGNHGTK